MKRAQISKYVLWVPPSKKEAMRVVAHGRYQQSQRRQLSLHFMGEKNPEAAFKYALSQLETMFLDGDPVLHITRVVVIATHVTRQTVTAFINEIEVTVPPGTNVSQAIAAYREAERETDDDIVLKHDGDRSFVLRARVSIEMMAIEALALEEIEIAVGWLDSIVDLTSPDVLREHHREKILELYARAGYMPCVSRDDFESTKESAGWHHVGLALDLLKRGKSLVEVIDFHALAAAWRTQYCTELETEEDSVALN